MTALLATPILSLFVSAEVDAGKWIIRENSNINNYPRRDFDFIEVHAKELKFSPFSYGQFGWSADIFDVAIIDVVNKGIDPGEKRVDSNSISWSMKEAFYIEISFSYAHNLGVMIMTGKAKVNLHCDNAIYIMHVTNNEIKPSITCGTWDYKDITITKGVGWESIKTHLATTLNKNNTIPTLFSEKFSTVLEAYYNENYRYKNGLLIFDDLNTKFNVIFKWLLAKTNPSEMTLDLTYAMSLIPTPVASVSSPQFDNIQPTNAPAEYSRMYIIDNMLILNVANIVLPKYQNKPILPNDVPKDSYWELELWNLQKALPDVLFLNPNSEDEDFHILVNYNDGLSKPTLDVVYHYEDFPYYRISNLVFDLEFLNQEATEAYLKVQCTIWVDLVPVVTEDPSSNMIIATFQAVRGDAIATVVEEWKNGGFVNSRGLDEFLDEGLNDYMIKQLGHSAFGSGLKFQDFSHKGGISYVEPMKDGLYIYLD
jgi:hypothetical protein